jgi:predicted ATPase
VIEQAVTEPRLAGREDELSQLRRAVEHTARHGATSRIVLLGPDGAGKSRLARELSAQLGKDALVLAGRCLPPGTDVMFWPLTEAFCRLGRRQASALAGEGNRDLIAERLVAGRVEDRRRPGRRHPRRPAVG